MRRYQTLKLLGRACCPFGSHNARGISLRSCARRILGLHPKREDVKYIFLVERENNVKKIKLIL